MFMAAITRRVPLLSLLPVAALAAGMTVQPAGNFTPAPGTPFKMGDRPGNVVAADANGDGAPDLLSANAGSVGVLLGNGRGAFRPAAGSPFAVSDDPHLLVTADFNADSKIDVAVTGHDSNGVTVLLGDGAGGFRTAQGSPFAAFSSVKPHNHGLAAGDVNGDGKPDVTMGHQDAGVIAVLLGDGRGSFAPAAGSPFRIGRGFYPHALGDVNGDGRIDVVAPDILGSAIVVAVGDGRGGFAAASGSPIAAKARPYFVLLDDVSHDGRLDVIATHDDSDEVDVLLGDGRGRFTAAPVLRSGSRGWTTVAADLDGDGRRDLVIAGMEGLKAFLGNGTGEFTHSPEWSVPTPRATWNLAAADFNRDGRPDLAFPDVDAGTVSVMLHRRAGRPTR
jgi:hypothetical protein